jgi:GcrA cell cycle regulator
MLDGRLERARALWDEGVSAGQIAARIGHGCTKSSIVGKAHRSGWPPRPSPIGRYLAEVREAAERVPDKPHHKAVEGATPKRRHQRVRPIPKPPQPVYVPPAPTLVFRSCQWPLGHPKERGFRFCEAAALEGKPYCQHHNTVAHERTPHRGDAMWGVSL